MVRAQYWFETTVFVLLLTSWLTPDVEAEAADVLGSLTTYKVLVSLAVCLAAGLAIALSVLFTFHLFLQFTGLGTYAWMIERHRKMAAKKKKAKAKEQELARRHEQHVDDDNDGVNGSGAINGASSSESESRAKQPDPIVSTV